MPLAKNRSESPCGSANSRFKTGNCLKQTCQGGKRRSERPKRKRGREASRDVARPKTTEKPKKVRRKENGRSHLPIVNQTRIRIVVYRLPAAHLALHGQKSILQERGRREITVPERALESGIVVDRLPPAQRVPKDLGSVQKLNRKAVVRDRRIQVIKTV